MLLELKAKHFKGTKFIDMCFGCAIEKAAAEKFNIPLRYISEGLDRLSLFDKNDEYKHYSHREYGDDEFYKDKEKAKQLRYSNQLIKRIKLTENI
jgi:hypothetical protein